MAVYRKNNRAYSIGEPLSGIFSPPVVAERAPTVNDNLEIGQVWIDKSADDVYFMVNRVANQSVFINAGGGSGTFDSLTVTNAATIGGDLTVTTGDFEVTAGDITIPSLAQVNSTVVLVDATGKFVTDALGDVAGSLIIGGAAGPHWTTLTAGGGITIVNADNSITISNPGATGTTFGTDAGGPVSPTAGGLTTFEGYNANITTDGATANIVKIRLADDIVSVASITATNDLTMTAGTLTVTSDDNSNAAVYIHANAGVNERIRLHSDQGTTVDSILLDSDVGGLTFTSGLASADAININASNAAGGIDVDYGTGGMTIDGANGAFTLQTGTANIAIGTDVADHDIAIGDNSGVNAMLLVSGTGHTAMTSAGNITLDSDGVLELNSSANIIGIGNDAVAQNINLGTGAAQRVVTIGNTSDASQVVLDCGTAGISVGASANAHTVTVGSTNTTSALTLQTGTGNFVQTAGGIWDVNAAGNVTIDSDGGTVSIAADDIDQAVNIGTDGERLVTIGSSNGAASTILATGTGNLDLGVSATAHTTRLGSTNTTCDTTIQSGTGAMTFTAGGIWDVNATGAVTVDGTSIDLSGTDAVTIDSLATIGIGVDDVDQAINIGTNGERVITIGNQVGAAGIVIESGTAATAINASGLLSTEAVTDTQAGAATTVSANVGQSIHTGLTTAAGATQELTITNALCTADSVILATCSNFGANDAQMHITRVVPGAGSFVVTVANGGAAACNGNISIAFWLLQV